MCSELQGFGQVAMLVLIEGEAGELLHQRAQYNSVNLAVAKFRSRSRDRRGREGAAQSLLFADPRNCFQQNIRRQAGVVGEQLANGDVLLTVGGELERILCYRMSQRKRPCS